ncbi:Autoinducer 2 sensor kinase/phosphatase LuxQ [Pigmentiphaga humi]|uniref:histidine kinase n=1 Tax=Pigmentiphaga humi TaxID=2478468 RepID=A0A3P4AXJ3_9BURK|nr:ATP-binding protein [Pigmentiphaga humi]VCU68110.1 Autoinducer 2 sensor kinase/phosphatase LuxQ [Pigmentiphaga humi]
MDVRKRVEEPDAGAPSAPGAAPTIDFRLLVNSIEDYAIFMLDPGGYVTTWNAGARKIKGYAPDEILGRHFSVFYPEDAIARNWPQQELEQAAARGRLEDEGWRVRKDGSTFWANVVITALYDDAGVLQGYAKVTRDMSERKRLEELELTNRRMSEFLATLGHELRNPLAPVRNAIGILRLQPAPTPIVAHCRDMIDRQVGHLARLVDDLLDIGRITSGKIELRLETVDLRDAIERSIEGVRFHTDARGQRLVAHMGTAPTHVRGDLTRLVQVVQNVLHNASKFSSAGSLIHVTLVQRRRSAVITVRDQGRGIPAHALETIFQPFTQESPQLNPTESGLGIGLTLCRSLVRMHGGAISAASGGPGLGSTFTIHLPLAEPERLSAPSAPTAAVQRIPLRVLVLDDNRDSADSLAMLLEIQGHDARPLYDAEAALQLAPEFLPQLVFIDLAMPVMDGFAALRAFKALPQLAGTMFVALTGYGQQDDRARTAEAGFDRHLVKPLDISLLDEMLDAAAAQPCQESARHAGAAPG